MALADELRRFLVGEPILARPISHLARAGRWCKRNPAVASLLCLTFAALTTGGGLATWQWRKAVLAREQADAEHQAEDEQEQRLTTRHQDHHGDNRKQGREAERQAPAQAMLSC